MIITRGITFCCLFLRLLTFDSGARDWQLKDQKDGISIYSRSSELSKFNDIEVEVDLPGTVAQLSSILLDVEKYPQWAFCTRSSTLVKRLGNNELIYYAEINAPWPLSNRDFYADVVVSYDSSGRSVNIVSTGLKDYLPSRRGLVRIPRSKAVWSISQKTGTIVHVQYILQVDPGGNLPGWIANMFATKGPMETFGNLKRKMETQNLTRR